MVSTHERNAIAVLWSPGLWATLAIAILIFNWQVIQSRALLNVAMVTLGMPADGETSTAVRRSEPFLERAALASPDDRRVQWNLGYLGHLAGQPTIAVKGWQNPGLASELIRRSWVWGIRQSDWTQSLAWADYAVQVDKTSAKAFEAQGAALEGLKRWRDAQVSYAQALELDPKNPVYYSDYARVIIVTGEDLDRAEQLLEASLELAPPTEGLYRSLASLAKMRKQIDQEIHWWESAASLAPEGSVDSLLHLAETYKRAGRTVDAVTTYARAARQAPDSLAVQRVFVQAYDPLLDNDAKYADVWLTLAQAKIKLGDANEARSILERILAHDPLHSDATSLLELLGRGSQTGDR